MKADPADQLTLLDLQTTDSALARLAHQKKTLPELARLAEIQTERAELDRVRVTHQTRAGDLEREQRKADTEVELVRTRKARDEDRLNSGAISNPKDLESLQHELVALERRIGVLEDAELEVMEALEAAQSEVSAVEAKLAHLDAERADLEAKRDTAVAELDEQATAHQADHADIVGRVPADLLALYEKLRAQYGMGAAALRQRRCEGCRLELNGSDLREIAAAAEDTVVRCPECSRILVRTAESGL